MIGATTQSVTPTSPNLATTSASPSSSPTGGSGLKISKPNLNRRKSTAPSHKRGAIPCPAGTPPPVAASSASLSTPDFEALLLDQAFSPDPKGPVQATLLRDNKEYATSPTTSTATNVAAATTVTKTRKPRSTKVEMASKTAASLVEAEKELVKARAAAELAAIEANAIAVAAQRNLEDLQAKQDRERIKKEQLKAVKAQAKKGQQPAGLKAEDDQQQSGVGAGTGTGTDAGTIGASSGSASGIVVGTGLSAASTATAAAGSPEDRKAAAAAAADPAPVTVTVNPPPLGTVACHSPSQGKVQAKKKEQSRKEKHANSVTTEPLSEADIPIPGFNDHQDLSSAPKQPKKGNAGNKQDKQQQEKKAKGVAQTVATSAVAAAATVECCNASTDDIEVSDAIGRPFAKAPAKKKGAAAKLVVGTTDTATATTASAGASSGTPPLMPSAGVAPAPAAIAPKKEGKTESVSSALLPSASTLCALTTSQTVAAAAMLVVLQQGLQQAREPWMYLEDGALKVFLRTEVAKLGYACLEGSPQHFQKVFWSARTQSLDSNAPVMNQPNNYPVGLSERGDLKIVSPPLSVSLRCFTLLGAGTGFSSTVPAGQGGGLGSGSGKTDPFVAAFMKSVEEVATGGVGGFLFVTSASVYATRLVQGDGQQEHGQGQGQGTSSLVSVAAGVASSLGGMPGVDQLRGCVDCRPVRFAQVAGPRGPGRPKLAALTAAVAEATAAAAAGASVPVLAGVCGGGGGDSVGAGAGGNGSGSGSVSRSLTCMAVKVEPATAGHGEFVIGMIAAC
jgi:hypothetical protein